MPKSGYKLIIPTSGIGSRLGDITKYTNKALVRVGKKPAIAYIIDSYPSDIEIVVTLRHFGNHVRDFLQLAYPNRNFTFVKEPNKPPTDSTFSMGNSMYLAKRHLQCPFIVQCCDTIVRKKVTKPNHNWTGGTLGQGTAQYSSITMYDDHVQRINAKGALEFDFVHIGLIGVKDYQQFWKSLRFLLKTYPKDATINDCQVINHMIQQGFNWKIKKFRTWFDTGNAQGLSFARKNIKDQLHNLEKIDESIAIFDDFVIKFYYHPKIVKEKLKRASLLSGLVPKVEAHAKNFFRYKFVEGNLYSRVVTAKDFKKFLIWSNQNLWKKKNSIPPKKFFSATKSFYFSKTQKRLETFFTNNTIKDSDIEINQEIVPPVNELLVKIDKKWLCSADQYQFHGDYILDNIIKTSKSYTLLDWRQNFGGLYEAGDIYYDLANLNHNLTINHDIISQDLFKININSDKIHVDILRPEKLVVCQQILFDFIINQGFDLKKTKVITAIKWLNMSPLHHHPFNLFLFYFGKLKLWRALNEN